MTILENFWDHVGVVDDGGESCWLWMRARLKRGYGVVAKPGAHTHLYCHQVAYRMVYGEYPSGFHIMHSCDNPPCVNPLHLSPGTPADNIHDAMRKGRFGKGWEALSLIEQEDVLLRLRTGEGVWPISQEYGMPMAEVKMVKKERLSTG